MRNSHNSFHTTDFSFLFMDFFYVHEQLSEVIPSRRNEIIFRQTGHLSSHSMCEWNRIKCSGGKCLGATNFSVMYIKISFASFFISGG